jgi:hypothetical protein
MLMVSRLRIRIRPPPVDDVNKLRHDWRCQRCVAPRIIHIRRNALFTSPEYAASRSAPWATDSQPGSRPCAHPGLKASAERPCPGPLPHHPAQLGSRPPGRLGPRGSGERRRHGRPPLPLSHGWQTEIAAQPAV